MYGSIFFFIILRKHTWATYWNLFVDAISIITKIRLFKYIENITTKMFPAKYSDIFHISAQNIGCGYSLEPPRRGSSNEYPQSMFFSRNMKNNVNPCKTPILLYKCPGLGGSVGCAVQRETRRSRVQPPPRSATFFRGD